MITCQPYEIEVINTYIQPVERFEFSLNFDDSLESQWEELNYCNVKDGVKIRSLVPGVSYKQILQSILRAPFTADRIEFLYNNQADITNIMSIMLYLRTDTVLGIRTEEPIYTTAYPGIQGCVIDRRLLITRFTAIAICNLPSYVPIKIRIYPSTCIDIAKNLKGVSPQIKQL